MDETMEIMPQALNRNVSGFKTSSSPKTKECAKCHILNLLRSNIWQASCPLSPCCLIKRTKSAKKYLYICGFSYEHFLKKSSIQNSWRRHRNRRAYEPSFFRGGEW